MCGEGLSKAQLKIDETVLDQSENESDLRSGRIFSLCASRIEEDLSYGSDENSCQPKPIAISTKQTETRNESKKLRNGENCLKVSDSASSGDLMKSSPRRNQTSEETSDDKFEKCKYFFSVLMGKCCFDQFRNKAKNVPGTF